jgi:hypothetical protein
MSDTTHDDPPLSASAALTLLRNQQRNVQNERGAFVFSITISWGIAWLVGFLALWSIDGLRPGFALPLPVAMTIFIALLVAAIVISIIQGVRSGRGIRGSADTFAGTVYGVSWSIVMIAIAVLGGALRANGMSPTLSNIFFACVYTLAVGLLYLIAGAIWHSVSSVVVGGWAILVAVVAPWFGYPTHYLVLAVGVGGAFLALAVWDAVTTRRVRNALAAGAE